MESTFKVFFSGQLKAGTSLDDAVQQMAALTGGGEDKIRELLTSGKKTLIRKNLTEEQARQYHKKLSQIGLELTVTRTAPVETPQAPPQPPAQEKPAESIGGLQMEAPPAEEESEQEAPAMEQAPPPPPGPNPYAAPAADLSQKQETVSEFLSEPRKLRAGRGWAWLTAGFGLFMQKPLTWLGMLIVFMLLLAPISMVPVVGSIANAVLGIVFGGGLMIGAHSLAEGNGLRFSHLFSGFTQGRNQLLIIGVLYLAGIIVISIIALIPLGGSMIPVLLGYGADDPMAIEQAFTNNLPLFMIGMLVAVGLSIPLLMSIWFAPSLAALADRGGVEAMKLSLRASLRNILPQLVYGLGIFLVGVIFSILMGILVGITAAFAGDGGAIFAAFIPIILVFLLGAPGMAVMVLSVYCAFRDIFCVES